MGAEKPPDFNKNCSNSVDNPGFAKLKLVLAGVSAEKNKCIYSNFKLM